MLIIKKQSIPLFLLIAVLFLSFVGIEPFPNQSAEHAMRAISNTGDLGRQLSYGFIFLASLIIFIKSANGNFDLKLPIFLTLSLAIILVSTMWSLNPMLTLRRSILTIMIVMTLFMICSRLSEEIIISVMSKFLVALTLVNIVSVFLIETASHQITDFRMTLANVGSWRGVHHEKNFAGLLAGYATIFLLYSFISKIDIKRFIFLVASITFLVGTQSKASLGICLISCIFMLFILRSTYSSKQILHRYYLVIYLIFITALILIIFWPFIVNSIFENGSLLTGRGYIWQVSLSSIIDCPVLGHGYRAYWLNPNFSYPEIDGSQFWVYTMSHGHNGYIEALLGVGLVGTLFMLGAMASSTFTFIKSSKPTSALWISSILYFALINITEVELFERDRPAFVIFIIAAACALKHANSSSSKSGVDRVSI